MAEDLRTRIALTIYGDGEELIWTRALALADLIIWELGLTQEYAYTRQPRRNASDYRYVTTWECKKPPYCKRCGIPHADTCKRETDV